MAALGWHFEHSAELKRREVAVYAVSPYLFSILLMPMASGG